MNISPKNTLETTHINLILVEGKNSDSKTNFASNLFTNTVTSENLKSME